MPRHNPYRAVHFLADRDDFNWLQREYGNEKMTSEIIRYLIKSFRQKRESQPIISHENFLLD